MLYVDMCVLIIDSEYRYTVWKYLMHTCRSSFRMHIHIWIELHQRFVGCNHLLFGPLAPVSVKQRVLSLYMYIVFKLAKKFNNLPRKLYV